MCAPTVKRYACNHTVRVGTDTSGCRGPPFCTLKLPQIVVERVLSKCGACTAESHLKGKTAVQDFAKDICRVWGLGFCFVGWVDIWVMGF